MRVVARIRLLTAQITEAQLLRQDALKEAQQLYRAQAKTVFEVAGQHTSWHPMKAIFKFRNDLIRPRDGFKGKLSFVGLQHIESNTGKRIGEDFIEGEELEGRKFRFSSGEIVYGYLRPYLNKVWIADREGICSVDQYVLQPVPELVNIQYLAHYMLSPYFVQQANALTNNLMLPRLRSGLLESVKIPVPPLAKQYHIAEYLDKLQERGDALNAVQIGSAKELEALLPVVLDRAFKGEL